MKKLNWFKYLCTSFFVTWIATFPLYATSNNFTLEHKEDSIQSLILQKTKIDTEFVNLFNHLAVLQQEINYDSSFYSALIAIRKAKEINFPRGLCYAYFNAAYPLIDLNRENESKTYLDSSLSVARIHGYKLQEASALREMGYLQNHPDSAIEFYNKSLNILKSFPESKNLAITYSNIGSSWYNKSNLDSAKFYFEESYSVRIRINDISGINNTLSWMALIAMHQGLNETALKLNFKVLRYYEKYDINPGFQLAVLNNISSLFERAKMTNEAKVILKKAIRLAKYNEHIEGISASYNQLGHLYLVNNELDLAEFYLMKALHFDSLYQLPRIHSTCVNLGNVYYKSNKLKKAEYYFNQAIKRAKEIGENRILTVAYHGKAKLLAGTGNNLSALSNAIRALENAKKCNFKNLISTSHHYLFAYYKALGDYKKAFGHYIKYLDLKDKEFKTELIKKVYQEQNRYDFEKDKLKSEILVQSKFNIFSKKQNASNKMQYALILSSIGFLILLLITILKSGKNKMLLEGLLFLTVLIIFESVLVLTDPYSDDLTSGAPAFKLLFNLLIVLIFIPLHQFAEKHILKRR